MNRSYLAILLVLSIFHFSVQSSRAESKLTVGWLEKVKLFPASLIVHAKLDSGADYSSLNATNLNEFEKEGKPWVKFEVQNRFGERASFELPVLRIAMIKKHFGKADRRPVVRLGICVGSRFMEADVNLVDRTNFENQMLIGRSFMAGNLVLDPATTFTAEPVCKGKS